MYDDEIKAPVHIASMFSGFNFEVRKSRRTQRGDLLDSFMEQLKPGYEAFTHKKLTYAFLSRLFAMRKMDTHQMYCLHQDCKRAQSFSKYFWWAMAESRRMQAKHAEQKVIHSKTLTTYR